MHGYGGDDFLCSLNVTATFRDSTPKEILTLASVIFAKNIISSFTRESS